MSNNMMGKGDEIINFHDENINLLMPESPPPYNTAILSQPGVIYPGYNHPGCYSGSHANKLHGGNYPSDGTFPVPNAPPPGPEYNLDLLQDLLVPHRKLTFHPSQSSGFSINQIRGPENQIVMSTLKTTVALTSNRHTTYSTTTSQSFLDQTGKILFIVQRSEDGFTVSSGDRIIGVSGSLCFPCGTHLRCFNSSGNIVFEIVRQPVERELHFEANGRTIAVARNSGRVFELELKDSLLDVQSKALIIAAANYLYDAYYKDGGFCARLCWLGIIGSIVFVIWYFVTLPLHI